MKVSENEVTYVAELAHLDLTSQERTGMVRDLNNILDYIDMLNELDTKDIEPMAQVMAVAEGDRRGSSELAYARRPDVLKPSLEHEAALANAPARNDDFFKVPKVIER
jgi:aspartyl-tRNA(Asn)/glutamyl-tRNA(Gln) amidotransferase subunit C